MHAILTIMASYDVLTLICKGAQEPAAFLQVFGKVSSLGLLVESSADLCVDQVKDVKGGSLQGGEVC